MSARPDNLSGRPEGGHLMDAVTDVIQSMQIVSAVQARLEATAPWGLKRDAIEEAEGTQSAASSPPPFAHFGMLTSVLIIR